MKKLPIVMTPARVVIAVGLIVLVVEHLIMLLMETGSAYLTGIPQSAWMWIDPITLIAIVSPVIYLLIFRPLNQYAEVKNKLVESERHFRAITESANDAIITAAGAGNITGWNAAAERLFGYTEAEITGQPLTLLMPERFRNLHSTGLARVVAGGTPHLIGKTVDVFGLRKDGSEFPLELSLAQWDAADGQFFTAIIRDITERQQAGVALRNSETRLHTIIENLTEGIAVSDLDGQLLHFNRAALDLHGFTTLDECRQHLSKFADTFELSAMDGTVLSLDQWPLARILRGENLRDLELRIRHLQAGWQRIYSYGGTLVHDDGQPLMAIVNISDITKHKQAEAKQAEQIEELRRWHDATSGREGRILELKHEINELLVQAGQPPRYPSAESQDQAEASIKIDH